MRLVEADGDLRVSDPDHVAVGELPVLDRPAVDRGAVGRAEIGEKRFAAIESDVGVLARHARVGEAERGILPASQQVGAPLEPERAPGTVLEVQADGQRGPALRDLGGRVRRAAPAGAAGA